MYLDISYLLYSVILGKSTISHNCTIRTIGIIYMCNIYFFEHDNMLNTPVIKPCIHTFGFNSFCKMNTSFQESFSFFL